jgi:hypothetical protein
VGIHFFFTRTSGRDDIGNRMIKFVMVESDFWGNTPSVKEWELKEEVVDCFGELCLMALNRADYLLNGHVFGEKVKIAYRTIFSRTVHCGLQVYEEVENVTVSFRVKRDERAEVESFVAYCIYAVQKEFGGHASSIYEVYGGWIYCEVALKAVTARKVIAYLKPPENNDL